MAQDSYFSAEKFWEHCKEPGGAAIEDLEDPKAKAGRYLQIFERLDTTGLNLNNPSVIMSREKKPIKFAMKNVEQATHTVN